MKNDKDISTKIGNVLGTCLVTAGAGCLVAIAIAFTIKLIAWIL